MSTKMVIIMASKKTLIDHSKDTIGLGVTSMAGMGVMGGMAAIPGMPAAAGATVGTVGAGLNLANVGQMAKVGMAIPGILSDEDSYYKKKRKR